MRAVCGNVLYKLVHLILENYYLINRSERLIIFSQLFACYFVGNIIHFKLITLHGDRFMEL